MADRIPHIVGMMSEVAHDDVDATLGWCDDQVRVRARPDPTNCPATSAPGGLRTRSRRRAAHLRRLRHPRVLDPPDRAWPGRRRHRLADGQTDVVAVDDRPAAAQRGSRRSRLLQLHRGRGRPRRRHPTNHAAAPPARRLDRHRRARHRVRRPLDAAGRVIRDNSKWSPQQTYGGGDHRRDPSLSTSCEAPFRS